MPDKSDLDHKQSTYGDAHEKLQNPYWCKERFEMPAYESAVIQLADFVYNYDGGFELEGSVDDKDADSDTFDTEFWGKRAFMADLNDGAEFGIISHGSCYRLLRQAGLSLDFSEIWNNINDSNWPDLMDTEDMEVSRSTSRLITETDRGYHRSSGKKLKKHQSII